MKSFLIRGTIGTLAFLALTGLIGLTLQAENTITRSIKLVSPADEVWERIYNYNALPDWNPNIASVEQLEMKPELIERWKITYTDGNTMTLTKFPIKEKELLTSKIVDTSYPFSGSWVFELKPYGNGKTFLTLTEHSTLKNPYYRLIATLTGRHYNVETFLEQVAASLGQPNVIIEK